MHTYKFYVPEFLFLLCSDEQDYDIEQKVSCFQSLPAFHGRHQYSVSYG